MKLPYEGLIVVITGASSGHGRAIVTGAARQGARAVIINYASNAGDAVDAAHARAMEPGGTFEGPPGFRGPEEMGFYAAHFRDPDGNKLVVARMGAQ